MYVPVCVTVMLVAVTPLLHTTVPLQPVAVKVALAPAQMLVVDGVTTGADGESPDLITTEALLVPHTVVQVAV